MNLALRTLTAGTVPRRLQAGMAHLGKRKVSGRQGARDLQDGMSSDDEDLEVSSVHAWSSVQLMCMHVAARQSVCLLPMQ